MSEIIAPKTTEFTIQVDQREQAPYLFDGLTDDSGNPLFVWRNDATLETGDYSIKDMESQVTVERKSHIDFLGSITKGRVRFEREFQRMQEMEHAAIVIEADYQTLFNGHPSSQVNKKTIQRTIVSWQIRYPKVQWQLCLHRRHAEMVTFRFLSRFWELKQAKEI